MPYCWSSIAINGYYELRTFGEFYYLSYCLKFGIYLLIVFHTGASGIKRVASFMYFYSTVSLSEYWVMSMASNVSFVIMIAAIIFSSPCVYVLYPVLLPFCLFWYMYVSRIKEISVFRWHDLHPVIYSSSRVLKVNLVAFYLWLVPCWHISCFDVVYRPFSSPCFSLFC